MKFESGIHYDISNNDYHNSEGFSSTKIKHVLRSGYDFEYFSEHRQETTPAMEFGTLIHSAILEPDTFKDTYVTADHINRKTKVGREEYQELLGHAYNCDLILTKESTIQEVEAIKKRFYKNPEASGIMSLEGKSEVSAFAVCPITKMILKARADRLFEVDGKFYIMDIKTCKDASKKGFSYAVKDYSYDISASFYMYVFGLAGIEISGFIWIACQKTEPLNVATYRASHSMLEIGKIKYEECLNKIQDCMQNGFKDIGDETIIDLEPSEYELRQYGL